MSDPQLSQRVSKGYAIPQDWPELSGPIDLTVHDLPHASAQTEWWYVSGHVKDEENHDYSFHVAFFRIATGRVDADGKPQHLHSMTSNIIDVASGKSHFFSYLDPHTPAVLKHQLETHQYHLDPRLSKALLDVVSKGNVPLPDLAFKTAAFVAEDGLMNLDYTQGNMFRLNADGTYTLAVNCQEKQLSFSFDIKPTKGTYRQGSDGVVQVGVRQETMFYYFTPRCELKGQLFVQGKTLQVTGDAWIDHEFGGKIDGTTYNYDQQAVKISNDMNTEAAADVECTKSTDAAPTTAPAPTKDESLAWNWFAMQLDGNREITATNLINIFTNEVTDNFLIFIDENGNNIEYRDVTFTSSKPWISVRSGNSYPLEWSIQSPSGELFLELKAVFANQEIFTLLSRPAYWEGRLEVSGTYKGKPISGHCLLERHGFEEINSLDRFFKIISTIVRDEICQVIPFNPNRQQMIDIMANDDNTHYLDGVSSEAMNEVIIKPLREIIDRGGKSWRSYALLLCIDAVGGDSFKYQHWLAMPELMHVSSLIIDDIQDKSTLRRGKPCCHIVHGEPLAINAGTAGYFLAMHLLQSRTPDLTPELRNMLYDLYFLTLRAGHCGQGFDIFGLEYRMTELFETGNSDNLLRSIISTHRLKSAVPAGNLARMGAIIGGGSKSQVDGIGNYLESIGIAFQIIDDVLNLSGLEDNGVALKTCGEDLVEGKLQYVVCRAMVDFTPEERKVFWEKLKAKPDYPTAHEMIRQLQDPRVDALNKSRADATRMVEDAFAKLDLVIPDSYYKIMLRAFGDYVLDRHY